MSPVALNIRYQIGITLGLLLLYGMTAASHYVGGDQAIFVTVAVDGGFAHAPGYPLYSMYLYATRWGDNPWLATSLSTAVLGALAVGVLFRAMVAWGASRGVALFAALIFGLGPQVWFYHSKAEVFAGNNLAVAAILWACAPGPSKRPTIHVFWLGLLAGLAISHHHTAVFMAPLGLWKVWTLIKDKPQRSLLGLAGLATGLLPYLWLPYIHMFHRDRWHWGAPDSLDGFLHVFLRKDYGTFTMAATEELALIPGTQLMFLLKNAASNLLLTPILGLVGLGLAWKAKKLPRPALVALTLAVILAGPVFVSLMHREPVGLDTLLVSKFHQMFFLLLVFAASFAAPIIPSQVSARMLPLISGLLTVLQVSLAFDYLTRNQHPAPHYLLHDLWSPLPDNAVLIASGDHLTAGSWAYLRSKGDSRDVIAPHLLIYPWYRQNIEEKYQIALSVAGTTVNLTVLLDELHRRGHSTFLSEVFDEQLLRVFPNHPVGLVIHFMPKNETPPSPYTVFGDLREFMAATSERDFDGGVWAEHVESHYANVTQLLQSVHAP